MLRMRACQEILKKDEITGDEALVLQKALDELPLRPLCQQQMLTKIIAYYKHQTQTKTRPWQNRAEPIFCASIRKSSREKSGSASVRP